MFSWTRLANVTNQSCGDAFLASPERPSEEDVFCPLTDEISSSSPLPPRACTRACVLQGRGGPRGRWIQRPGDKGWQIFSSFPFSTSSSSAPQRRWRLLPYACAPTAARRSLSPPRRVCHRRTSSLSFSGRAPDRRGAASAPFPPLAAQRKPYVSR